MYFAPTIEVMQLSGGAPCLDFVNSASISDGVPVDRLRQYADLVTLAERVGLFDKRLARDLNQRSVKHPKAAQRVLSQAKKIREVMALLFEALALNKIGKLDKEVIDAFNDALQHAAAKRGFKPIGNALNEDWRLDTHDLQLPLYGFILSAEDILQPGKQPYIKKCKACEWLFLDTSKSHKRKWCDMQTCGSATKSKRYYQKKKASSKGNLTAGAGRPRD